MNLFAKSAVTLLAINLFTCVFAQHNHLNLPPLPKDQPSHLPANYQQAIKEEIRSFKNNPTDLSSVNLHALDSIVIHYGDTNLTTSARTKITYEYDYEGREVNRKSFFKNINQPTWKLESEVIHFYRSNPHELEVIGMNKISGGIWDTTSVTLYQMDEFGRDTAYTFYSYQGLPNTLKFREKKTYQYNSNDDIVHHKRFASDAIGNVYQSYEVDYVFNSLFQITEMHEKQGQPGSPSVLNWGKTYFSYDSHGNLLEQLVYLWDYTNSNYYPSWRFNRFYSLTGKYLGAKTYYPNPNSSNPNDFVLKEEFNIEYDSTGGRSLEHLVEYNIQSGSVSSESKRIYTNNVDGNPVTILYLIDLLGTSVMDSVWQRHFTYNSQGLAISEKLVQKTTTSWLDIDRFFYGYDSQGRQTSYEKQWFNPTTGLWENQEYYTTAYDALDHAVLITEYTPDGSSYSPVYIRTMDTDVNYLKSDIVVPAYFYNSKVNFILAEFPKSPNNDRLDQYFWSDKNFTSVDAVKEAGLNVYPNPVVDLVQIEFEGNQAQLNVYDISGRLIKMEIISPNQQVNFSDLKSGVYVYVIQTNQETYRGKLVKE